VTRDQESVEVSTSDSEHDQREAMALDTYDPYARWDGWDTGEGEVWGNDGTDQPNWYQKTVLLFWPRATPVPTPDICSGLCWHKGILWRPVDLDHGFGDGDDYQTDRDTTVIDSDAESLPYPRFRIFHPL
jgi:hypothetical protein